MTPSRSSPSRFAASARTGWAQIPGAGLGLSIVAAIAEAHRGTLELRARPDGGLRACIGLPSS